jgi:multiple sugar transport system permease protein
MPSVLYILVLVAVPFVLAVGFALSDVTTGDPSFDWVGLRNFRLVFEDPVFWQSLWNTLIFTGISMVLIVVFGKILANILVANFRGKWVVRFLVLLPWTTPVALSAVAWLWLLDSIYSPIDWVLRQLGLLGQPGCAARARVQPVLPGPARPRDGFGDRGPRLAAHPAVGRHHDGRPGRDPARPRGSRQSGRCRLLAAHVRDHHPDGAAGRRRRRAVRGDLHLHRHGGRRRAHQRRPQQRDPGADELGVLPRHRRRRRRAGAAIALFLFPILLAAAIAILRAVRRMEIR